MSKAPHAKELPQDFLNRMSTLLGSECTSYEKAICTESPTSIRLHPYKGDHRQYDKIVPWCQNGYYLLDRPSFHLDPLWHAGAYYVQEASSMFLEQIFRSLALPDEPIILDACAAPGGKSTHLLSLMDHHGLLISNEIISKRNKVLVENVSRWGMANQIVIQAAVPELRTYDQRYDLVLVDAPCSGEGLFRKDERAIREWSVEHSDACAQRQHHILSDLSDLVVPGGYLIYSTCTHSEAENEDQIAKLIQSNEWDLVRLPIEHFQGVKTGRDGIGFRFYPHRVEGEGHFISCIRRKGPTNSGLRDRSAVTGIPDELNNWLDNELCSAFSTIDHHGNVYLFPTEHLTVWEHFNRKGKIRYFGVQAGEFMRGELKPHHHLALSHLVDLQIPIVDVDLDRALKYLKKEDIGFSPSYPMGWNLVRYKGVNLGWIKVLQNRINNYYPKSLSIRP